MSATGLTAGEISAHLAEVHGADVSRQTISTITDKVIEGMNGWQNRPLDPVYPVVFLDAIHVKIRDEMVSNRPVYVALAVTCEGHRDILGLWAGDGGEGAKHWLHVLTELKNRGVEDVCMATVLLPVPHSMTREDRDQSTEGDDGVPKRPTRTIARFRRTADPHSGGAGRSGETESPARERSGRWPEPPPRRRTD